MLIKKNQSIAIAALKINLGGKIPSEIRLTPSGKFSAKDGRPFECDSWVMNSNNAASCIAYAKSIADDAVVDYEHQTLHSVKNGQPAPAAAWFRELEWREGDGLYTTDIRFTKKAEAAILAGEYRYISPVILYNKETGDALAVTMAALTNHPAIDDLEDLTAQAALKFNTSPEDKSMDKFQEVVLSALGLRADATQEQVLGEIAALQANVDRNTELETQMAALTADKPDLTQFVPKSMFDKLNTEFVALKNNVEADGFETLFQAGVKKGALADNKEVRAWAQNIGNAALKQHIELNAGIAALSGEQSHGKEPEDQSNEHGLSESDVAVCSNMGLSEQEFATANGYSKEENK